MANLKEVKENNVNLQIQTESIRLRVIYTIL